MTRANRKPKVFMMDLWATVPYYTAYLSKALLQEGVDLTVGSISYYLDPECFRSRGLSLDPGLINIVGRFSLPKLPRRIFKLIESTVNLLALSVRFLFSPPDIIHVQFLPMLRWHVPMDLWFVKFFQRRNTKIVLTVHDLLPHDTGNRYKDLFQSLYSDVDAIICHSDHVAARLEAEFHVPISRISIIPHGPFFYDLPIHGSEQIVQSFGLKDAYPLFLFQGIILPYKGVDLLLNAWRLVEDQNADAWLVIAGTGSAELLDQLRLQMQTLDLQRVRLHFSFISTEELVTLYTVADVVVYPYRAVTTSGALATGLALGKALVASDIPVFRELLTDEISALLIDPQDTHQLASALLCLAVQPELREALSVNVKEMQFGDRTWQAIAKSTASTYEKVLSPPEQLTPRVAGNNMIL
jgi:glycosyltransferase involved in cell wall biosynthesis